MQKPGPRSKVRRLPERGHYDRAEIHPVLDEGLVAHVGFCMDGQPFVIPMAYARHDDDILLHGSVASRLLKALAGGVPVSLCMTLLDGLVLARSVFNHSMNYRSVVAFGVAREIVDKDEKSAALDRLTEHLVPGRLGNARAPNRKELGATRVLRMTVEEASLKMREGGVGDNPADLELDHWAGVIPLELKVGEPMPDPACAGMTTPDHVRAYRRN